MLIQKNIFINLVSFFRAAGTRQYCHDNVPNAHACFQATQLLVIALLLISILYSLWLLYLDNETFTFFEFSFVPVALIVQMKY